MPCTAPAPRRSGVSGPFGTPLQLTEPLHEVNDKLTIGNAAIDSQEFRRWIVGDIESWTGGALNAADRDRIGLRDSKDLELRWVIHPKGERRPGGWASRSEKRAISILIRGSFVVSFRDPLDYEALEEVSLRELGDYVVWAEELEHHWRAEDDSLVLTVRWLPGRT